jgi:hypothetical protein
LYLFKRDLIKLIVSTCHKHANAFIFIHTLKIRTHIGGACTRIDLGMWCMYVCVDCIVGLYCFKNALLNKSFPLVDKYYYVFIFKHIFKIRTHIFCKRGVHNTLHMKLGLYGEYVCVCIMYVCMLF